MAKSNTAKVMVGKCQSLSVILCVSSEFFQGCAVPFRLYSQWPCRHYRSIFEGTGGPCIVATKSRYVLVNEKVNLVEAEVCASQTHPHPEYHWLVFSGKWPEGTMRHTVSAYRFPSFDLVLQAEARTSVFLQVCRLHHSTS